MKKSVICVSVLLFFSSFCVRKNPTQGKYLLPSGLVKSEDAASAEKTKLRAKKSISSEVKSNYCLRSLRRKFSSLSLPIGRRCSYRCHICRGEYSSRKGLSSHVQTMHQDAEHLCAICMRLFSSSSILRHHMKTQVHRECLKVFLARPFGQDIEGEIDHYACLLASLKYASV